MVNLVLGVLDDSKSGLIPQKELKEAVIKVANENNLDVDNQTLTEMVDAVYMNDDGTKANKMSRQSVRVALEQAPEMKVLSE